MFILATTGGDAIDSYAGTLAGTISWAYKRLEEDPEAGTLELYEVGREDAWRHRRTITFGPDADWQSVVVILEPGEKVEAPGPVPTRITEDDLDAYPIGHYKRQALEEIIDRGGY